MDIRFAWSALSRGGTFQKICLTLANLTVSTNVSGRLHSAQPGAATESMCMILKL